MIPLRSALWLDHRSGWRLWIPLFPVWLLLIIVGLLLFPLALIAGIVLGVDALEAYATAWSILSAMKNTVVEVDDPEVHVRVRFA